MSAPTFLVTRLRHRAFWVLLATLVLCTASSAADTGSANYRLQPMDMVRVQVFQEGDLDRELRVPADGMVDFPLIGKVALKNRSIREVQTLLTERYREDYLVNPQINVSVLEYAPRTVNILGAVNSPGSVPIPPEAELSLLDAIARSGGFSRLANRSRVSLTRTMTDGRTENFTINADQIVAGGASERWLLVSGDVVYVGERVL